MGQRKIQSIPVYVLLVLIPLFLQFRLVGAQYFPHYPLSRAENDALSSNSREIYIAGHDDFCLFGPANPGSAISASDQSAVSWCNKAGHNTRVIPQGAIKGVTYMKAKNWVQVSGVGDLTKLNIKPGDWGGQFDSKDHKPDGAKVMGGTEKREATSWVTMMSPETFCFRACFGDPSYCPTNFADKGCYWLLSDAVGYEGTFQSCSSEDGQPPDKQGEHAPEWVGCTSGQAQAGGPNPPPPSPPPPHSSGPDDHHSQPTSTSWVAVPTCIPCPSEGAPSAPPPSASSIPPVAVNQGGTIQQGVTKVGEGIIAAESGIPSFISAPSTSPTGAPAGNLILKRDEQTTISNGQCCFTTWTPTVIGGAGPTASSPPTSVSGSLPPGGAITGITPANVTGTALITNPSQSVNGSQAPGASPLRGGNATVSGGGNGTKGNGSDGNGSESYGSRVIWGVEGPGVGWAALVAVCAVLGGWSVL